VYSICLLITIEILVMILMVIIFVYVLKLVKAVNRKKYEIDRIKKDENIDNKHI